MLLQDLLFLLLALSDLLGSHLLFQVSVSKLSIVKLAWVDCKRCLLHKYLSLCGTEIPSRRIVIIVRRIKFFNQSLVPFKVITTSDETGRSQAYFSLELFSGRLIRGAALWLELRWINILSTLGNTDIWFIGWTEYVFAEVCLRMLFTAAASAQSTCTFWAQPVFVWWDLYRLVSHWLVRHLTHVFGDLSRGKVLEHLTVALPVWGRCIDLDPGGWRQI